MLWTFIALFLYLEIFLSAILLIPFIPPSRWQKIFRSNLIKKIESYSHIYFNVLIAILSLVFLESIREMRKYNEALEEVDLKNNRESELAAQVKLFRAQRNFYISGFALFMWFILKRLVTQTSKQAHLEAECEASQKQAKQASAAAQILLDQADNTSNKKKEDNDTEEEKSLAQQLDKTKEDLVKTKIDLKKAVSDLEAVRKQAEGTNREYDRLMKEHSKLQQTAGETSSKKE
ncbi:B-cell receptor-associated protein 31-like isoform X3 [Mytilus californianus]|uniref:B-cell receptor-associated protein 31-like isoform X3 n=1 Tax=Mytilus californianus TaxID=6549 RepID=UPI0022482811|nr:B-cell receptor-associated protein 31-like isoform X3 [Mytilus californianus]XP_052068479.1 B-cell receptor-associated protein 31-like isoform X3 [Mytilus californianus]XP_052068487.1 B-cell receptor-associated protein 31-like isoform X3 [Mytilus californianus]